LPSYAFRVNPTAHPSSIALYFWVSELIGRLLMSTFTTQRAEAALYRISAVVLIVTEVLLLTITQPSPITVVALTVLSGLTLAPLYPLIVSFLLARTGSDRRLGPLFAAASLGGATLPWFTGIASTHFHHLRAGLTVPAIGAILLLALSVSIISLPEKHAQLSPSSSQ
jgi:fucose permease